MKGETLALTTFCAWWIVYVSVWGEQEVCKGDRLISSRVLLSKVCLWEDIALCRGVVILETGVRKVILCWKYF